MRLLKQKGFTLIELMVSVAIILILTSVVIAQFGPLSKSRNLKHSRDNMISDIRKVQSFSLSAKNVSGTTPSSAYGIILDTASANTYRLIAEDNANPVNRTTLETIKLPENTYIKTISVKKSDGTIINTNSLTIFFKVPYGRVLSSYGTIVKEANDILTVVLSAPDDSVSGTVVINGITGLISLQ